ncbi:MAG: DNA/RNA non-specific endonuclease [Bacteroidales bacterium]|nr:DNA/RNA non-specific endonuclease [Bacteroidales bacterium]
MKVLAFISLFLLATCSSQVPQVPSSDSAGLELPAYGPEEDIIVHLGYTASYNHTTLCPDWVAWELTAEEADGQNDGQFSFSRDPDVQFPKASREDYSRSGYDKGHMAPRADMRWSCQALEESYYFTNICPQDHEMNSQAWRKIEELTRRLAKRYGSVWVVCGPIFDDSGRKIGGVAVPSAFFKALAVNTAEGYRTVGFLVDNDAQSFSPRHYAVSVDSVEVAIGRNLFPLVDEAAEAEYDWKVWNH